MFKSVVNKAPGIRIPEVLILVDEFHLKWIFILISSQVVLLP